LSNAEPSFWLNDRSRGLQLFGGVLVAVGLLFGGVILLWLALAPRLALVGHHQEPAGNTLGFLIPVGKAALLVWLGVGSMLARRWARALIVAGMGVHLVFGVLGLAMLPVHLGQMDQLLMPQGGSPQIAALARRLFAGVLVGMATDASLRGCRRAQRPAGNGVASGPCGGAGGRGTRVSSAGRLGLVGVAGSAGIR